MHGGGQIHRPTGAARIVLVAHTALPSPARALLSADAAQLEQPPKSAPPRHLSGTGAFAGASYQHVGARTATETYSCRPLALPPRRTAQRETRRSPAPPARRRVPGRSAPPRCCVRAAAALPTAKTRTHPAMSTAPGATTNTVPPTTATELPKRSPTSRGVRRSCSCTA